MKVLVQSFSYKRTGYPKDETGKGGGFVFDCRGIDAYDYSLDEPGAPFRHLNLTGLDSEVSDALENDSDTQRFFQAVWVMVEMDIFKCLRRGFQVMTVNFGCTAGRHRSVYLAEKLAGKIRERFTKDWLEVELVHLEKPYWPQKV